MGRTCVVEVCGSEYYPDCGLSFHRFPKDPIVREIWINIIPMSSTRKLTDASVVCSKHFKAQDFVAYLSRPVLKCDAVPTVFLLAMKTEVQDEATLVDSPSSDSPTQTASPEAVKEASQDTSHTTKTSEDEKLIKSVVEVVFNFDGNKTNDVDKFKRRLIRSIARYMFVEKVPEEEMWTQLLKDTDCDCKLLWKRMRTLTLKKLRRLLLAEDCWEKITKIARLTSTDWLLFDLVLVHEKFDLIGQDDMSEKNYEEPKVLEELFELVQKFNIEQLTGEDLIRGWLFLTLEYNNYGRQCSPMILQRRWYQMKQLARLKFYNFWFAYGGAPTKLEKAWQQKPTNLQAKIAKKYKSIIIEPFATWEDMVINKRVITREDFENLGVEKPANNVNVADVQIIETPVETIHIDSDAEDDETVQEKSVKPPQSAAITVRTNPEGQLEIHIEKIMSEVTAQSSNSEVKVLEDMHIPIQQKKPQSPVVALNSGLESNMFCSDAIPNECHNEVLPKITSVTGGVELLDSDDDDDDALITFPEQVASNESEMEVTSQNVANTTVNIPEDVCTSKQVPEKDSASSSDKNKVAVEDHDYEVPYDDLIILDDGIDLEDDGLEFQEEDDTEDLVRDIKSEPTCGIEENKNDTDEAPKFDYKLLLTPVVRTKKLNEMDVFKLKDYTEVRDRTIIERCDIESKPITPIKVKKENIEVLSPKKELQCDKKECVSPESVENASEEHDSVCVSDSQRVKYSSWILQKPKNRSYNPIQLCKNPDFNTRLKRLTAGFLSCEKNRLLLKECKRLTIDLHKTFEHKLIDGKIYLKNSKFTDNLEIKDTCIQTLNLDPTTKSQTAATKVSISNIVPIITSSNIKQNIIEREIPIEFEDNNGNNLTDTCKINNKLLTVEITPIKANNIHYKPPVEIVVDLNAKHTEQDQHVINQDQTSSKSDNCEISKDSIEDNVNGVQCKVTDNTDSIDLDEDTRIMNKRRFQNMLGKINGPKNFRFGYTLNTPSRTRVTWNSAPKPSNNTGDKDRFGDVLLASDTLEKMLKLLTNQTIDDKRKKKKRKLIELEQAEKHGNNETQEIIEDTSEKQNKRKRSIPTENNETSDKEIAIKKPAILRRGRLKKMDSQSVSHLKSSRYCCWALEKLMTNKNPKEPHYCPKPICICCCRDRLLEKSLHDKQLQAISKQDNNVSKTRKNKEPTTENTTQTLVPLHNITLKPPSMPENDLTLGVPIVLSDDDDDDEKNTCQNLETNTDSIFRNTTDNTNSNPHPNSEENTNKTSLDVEEGTKSTSEISENLKINTVESLIAEDTTLTSQSNIQSSTPSCKTRVLPIYNYVKPPPTFIDISGEPKKQVPSKKIPQNDPTISPKLYGILSSTQKNIKESITFSGNDVYLKESLLNNSFPNIIKPSKVPIYLGKNKILLCSNHVSQKLNSGGTVTEKTEAILPPGVQIVLLPSGELALSIEPGINFTPDEISELYVILTAVQQQLTLPGADSSIIKNSEVLNIDIQSSKNTEIGNKKISENENVTESNEQKSDSIKHSIELETATSSAAQNNIDKRSANLLSYSNTVLVQKNLDSETVPVQKKLDSETVSVQKNLDSETVPVQKNLDSETVPVQKKIDSETASVQKNLNSETDSVPKNVVSEIESVQKNLVSETISVQKNLVSETVSIGDVDKIKENCSEPQEIVDDQTLENSIDSAAQNNKKSILSDLMEMSGISENDALCDDKIQINASKECRLTSVRSLPKGALPRKVVCNDQNVSRQFDILNKPVIYKALEKRKELSIVSSFNELKDCHEKSCQFYKMDTETGQILPINLKIKRGGGVATTAAKRKLMVKQYVDPKCIIDLTDDQVNLTDETASSIPKASSNKTSERVIKPIKLIRSAHSIARNKSVSLQSFKPLSSNVINILTQKKSLLLEESISSNLDNTTTDKINSNEETINKTDDSNDSDSDDEPLAKKAMRKRENDISAANLDTVSALHSVMEEKLDDELTEYLIPEFFEPDCVESNDEDAEENCILGV